MQVNGAGSTLAAQMNDFAGALVSIGADPALIVYAEQIQQMNGNIQDALNQVHQIQSLRTAINTEIDKMRELKAKIVDAGTGDGDQRKLRMCDFWDPATGQYSPQYTSKDFSIGEDGTVKKTTGAGIGTPTTGDWVMQNNVLQPTRFHDISVADVDKEINRLQGLAQTWDNNRELQMIVMQGELNKKEQAVTLLSNFIKKSGDTQMAVVNNLK